MTRREAQEITMALVAIQDARRAVGADAKSDALAALEDATARLDSVPHTRGVSVARAARLLEVSQPTVRAWLARNLLVAVEGSRPEEVEIDSLRRVRDALVELRAHGHDRDWVEQLATYLQSAQARPDSLEEGLAQLRRGALEPA
jgi:hypothetical protein